MGMGSTIGLMAVFTKETSETDLETVVAFGNRALEIQTNMRVHM